MELIGKIKAKIYAHTFDGVPKDTEITIFVPGLKHPLKGMLSDIEIEGAAAKAVEHLAPATGVTWPKGSQVSIGGWSTPSVTFYDLDIEGKTVYQAMGFATSPSVSGQKLLDTLKEAIPSLADIRTPCPVCLDGQVWAWGPGNVGLTEVPLTDVIMHLNDHHHWSREAIASWLEEQDWDLQFVTPEGETA